MVPAAAAGLETRTRYALAFAVLGATALLTVLNPWLAFFAVAGFALGWFVRNPRRVSRMVSLKRILVGMAVLVVVAVAALVVLAYLFIDYTRSPGIPQVVPVSYSVRATLEGKRDAFALREQLVVSPESLKLLKEEYEESASENPAEFLARSLAPDGWVNPRLVGETLELSRESQSNSTDIGFLTRRATVALPIPDARALAVDLEATEGTVDVIAPEHWVLATAPPSEPKTLPGGQELRRMEFGQGGLDGETIEVELAGPLFRNELGTMLLALSVAGAVKWGVLLVFGVFQDELKKLVAAILGKARRRRRSAPTPASPPPAQS